MMMEMLKLSFSDVFSRGQGKYGGVAERGSRISQGELDELPEASGKSGVASVAMVKHQFMGIKCLHLFERTILYRTIKIL